MIFASRKLKAILTTIVFMASSVCGIIAVIFVLPFLYRLIIAVVYIGSFLCAVELCRCPHCNRFGLRVIPFDQEKIFCKYCKKKP